MDDLFSPILTEVDIEVGHRDTLGIEEAFEQQSKAQGVEVGNRQRPGNERARPRTTARPDRNAMLLGPFDEVRDDQEVAGKLHRFDDAKLKLQPVPIVLLLLARRKTMDIKTVLQPLLGLPTQFSSLMLLGFFRIRISACKTRKNRLDGPGTGRTTPCNLDGIVKRLGQIGEELGHLFLRLEIMFGRQMAAIILNEDLACGDCDQRIMRLEIPSLGKIDIVGGDQWNVHFIGEIKQQGLDDALMAHAMSHHLDIKTVIIESVKGLEALSGDIDMIVDQHALDRPVAAAGQADDPFGKFGKVVKKDMGFLFILRLKEGTRDETHQIGPTGIIGPIRTNVGNSVWPVPARSPSAKSTST